MGVIENRIDITELERSGGGGGGGTAASVSYDNTSSGLSATDVQAALDELNLDIVEGLALVDTSVAANRAAITATQENIAPVEDGETSTRAYVVGDYLMHLNSLMRVTAPIAIGDTLAAGTNIAAAGTLTDYVYASADTSDVDTTAVTVSDAKYMVKDGMCHAMVKVATLYQGQTAGIKLLGKFPEPKTFPYVYTVAIKLNDSAIPGYVFIAGPGGTFTPGNMYLELLNLPVGDYRISVTYPV